MKIIYGDERDKISETSSLIASILLRIFFAIFLLGVGFFYGWWGIDPHVKGGSVIGAIPIYYFIVYAISGLILLFTPSSLLTSSKSIKVIALIFVISLPMPFAIDALGEYMHNKNHPNKSLKIDARKSPRAAELKR